MNMRVLIISNNSFSNVYNNGKTLEAIFSAFPIDDLAQLFFHEESTPDFLFCKRYWKISELDIIKSIIKKKECIGNKIVQSSETIPRIDEKKYPFALRFIREKTGNYLRNILWRICRWESPALIEWVKSFDPHVVFLVGSSASFTSNVALRISSLINRPLVVYYTDDYLFSLSTTNYIKKREYKRVESLYRKVIEASSAQFVIGELMAKEYSKYFDKEFIPIMNSVPITKYNEYHNNSKIEMAYFGGLHLNRWKMIARLAKLLPNDCSIAVYSAQSSMNEIIRREFKESGVKYKGTLLGDDLKEAMIGADILLHVESDDEKNRRFTRLAVSTKIPEYLITGRPVLGFGPEDVASMKILSDNSVGFVISSDDSDMSVKNLLQGFINDYDKRRAFGRKGYEFAKEKFDIKVNSHNLLRVCQILLKSNMYHEDRVGIIEEKRDEMRK